LLSTPEPKDPQDAEVAKMMIQEPERFAAKAHEWAVQYAGATYSHVYNAHSAQASLKEQQKPSKEQEDVEFLAACHGYAPAMVRRFVSMGFPVQRVVSALEYVGIDENDGVDYELEEAFLGDITATLLGEP
jgi:ubiquitin-conjugating enzyme (huntingtin interacting protein 2)